MSPTHTPERSITSDRTPLGGIGALLIAVVLLLAAGSIGIVAGASLLILWTITPGVYTVAVAYLLFTVAVPEPTLLHVGGVGVGSLAVLVGSTKPISGRTVVEAMAGATFLWGIAYAAHRWLETMWLATLVLLGLVSLCVYALHRYELVRLGLVEADQ